MTGKKRKQTDDSQQVYSNKSRSRPSAETRIDPTYGQRSALPGLDEDTMMVGSDEELNYDDGMDALAYLRAVRKEATAIPNLLVAPRTPPSSYARDIYEEEPNGGEGWYEDGAYVAVSQPILQPSDDTTEEHEQGEAQLRYFDSILTRYEALREQLQQSPPPEALEKLGSERPTWVPKLNRGISQAWIRRMQTMDPKPAQLASMDKSSVLKLLRLLTNGTMLKRNVKVGIGISRWIWALLARLPGRGELNSEEIGVVRELGKKAVLIGMGLLEEKTFDEGIEELQKTFAGEEGEKEITEVVNEDEIDLDLYDSLDEDEDVGVPTADDSESNIVSSHPLSNISEPADTSEDTALVVEVLDIKGSPHLDKVDLNTQPASVDLSDSNEHHMLTTSENQKDNGSIEEGEVASGSISETLEEAKARIFHSLAEQKSQNVNVELEIEKSQEPAPEKFSSEWNTRTTVDMIITVAGEAYGQRDLLEFRALWIKNL